jgi:glycosyltransferase involved in cell wall biosynthesis
MDFSLRELRCPKNMSVRVKARQPVAQMKSERKRVLFVLPSLAGGGAERAVVMILRHMSRARFDLHLALVEAIGPYLSELPKELTVHDLKTRRVRYSGLGLIRLTRKLRPHVVVSSLPELNMTTALGKAFMPRGTRLLLVEQIAVGAHLADSRKHPWVWRRLYRHLYARADKVICVADYVLADMAERCGIPQQKLLRIYNPVDVERVRRLAEEPCHTSSVSHPHFIAVGRLVAQKGIDILLWAMVEVRARVPSAELTLVGEGPLKSELEKQAQQLGLRQVVHFAGFQSNPYPYIKRADVFVLSSRYEGLPLALLEALAVGTPVVAMDCPGGVREALADCPMGWLAPPLDPAQLAEAMIFAWHSSLKVRARAEEVEKILERFRVEQIAREYESVISSTCSATRSTGQGDGFSPRVR